MSRYWLQLGGRGGLGFIKGVPQKPAGMRSRHCVWFLRAKRSIHLTLLSGILAGSCQTGRRRIRKACQLNLFICAEGCPKRSEDRPPTPQLLGLFVFQSLFFQCLVYKGKFLMRQAQSLSVCILQHIPYGCLRNKLLKSGYSLSKNLSKYFDFVNMDLHTILDSLFFKK